MNLRATTALLALAGISVAVAGCGGGTQVAEIPARDITFPVLWAGADATGLPVGGIEPAGIAVETKDDPGFTVSLDDVKGAVRARIEAKGIEDVKRIFEAHGGAKLSDFAVDAYWSLVTDLREGL